MRALVRLAGVLALAAGTAPASAAVAPGSYCVTGLGGATNSTADGWLAVVTPAGAVTNLTPSLTTALIDPFDCAIDPATGDIIVVDEGPDGAGTDGRLYRVSVVGASVTQTTLHTGSPLVNPRGVTVGSDGTIYLSDVGAALNATVDGAVYRFSSSTLTRLDTAGVASVNPIDVDIDPRPFTGTSPGVNLILLERATGALNRVPLTGGTVVAVGSAGSNNWEALEVGPYGNYFMTRDGNSVERYDRLTNTYQQISSGGSHDAPLGITVDYYTGDLVVADSTDGIVNVPPGVYLGGATTSVVAAPGALPAGGRAAGIGFSPPLASTDPSINFGMPTRRAPIPGGAFVIIAPGSSTNNGDVEREVDVFVEVTSTASPLLIRLFDPNIRDGFDPITGGSFDTPTTISLTDPAGTTVTSVTLAANSRVELDQRIATLNSGNTLTVRGAGVTLTPGATGLYRLRVVSTAGDDYNAFGVWVERFHAYTFSTTTGTLASLSGVTPAPLVQDTFRTYPYFDRGCEYTVSNFDVDIAANPGSAISVTTRLGTSVPLTLSGNGVHLENLVDPAPGAGAAASIETDYGLHTITGTLAPNLTENNIVPLRTMDFQGWVDGGGTGVPIPVPPGNAAANPTASLRTSPGPAFPQTPFGAATNTFLRQYLPRYDETPGTAARPYAPYLMHAATPLTAGAPSVGSPSRFAIQVVVVNPDPVNALTGVTVTAPVPAPTVYVDSGTAVGGPATATGGATVTTCGAAPCSGSITASWPSIAAGSAQTLSYAVEVTPAFAGQRLYVSGGPAFRGGGATPAANAAPTTGTTATFTPAWSSGAFPRTESLGPLCDLSVVEGTATPVAVDLARLEAEAGDGAVLLRWETASELENLGFHVHRRLPGESGFSRITPALILGRGTSELHASYALLDGSVPNGVTAEYLLEDVAFDGSTTFHGPVSATPAAGLVAPGADPSLHDVFVLAGGASPEEAQHGSAGSASSAAAAAAGDLRVVARNPGEVEVEVEVPPLSIEPSGDADGSLRLSLPGWDSTLAAGLPELPSRTFWIPDVPRGAARIELIEREGESLVLEGPVLRVAFPEGAATSGSDDGADVEDPYPAQAAVVAGALETDAGRLLALRVQPVRQHAADGAIDVDRRLRLRIVFEPDGARLSAASAEAAAAEDDAETSAARVASTPGIKIGARGPGLVRVSAAELIAAGLDPGVDPRRLQLFRRGTPVAASLDGEADGVLDAEDALLFWSEGHEDRYGDVDVFFLVPGDGLASRVPDLPAAPAAPAPPRRAEALARFEEQRVYLPALRNGEGDNFVGRYVFDRPVTAHVPAPGATGEAARLRVRLVGGTRYDDVPQDHFFQIAVGGSWQADARFDGGEVFEAVLELPAGLAGGESLEVTLSPTFASGAPFDLVYLDALELEYRRDLALEADDEGGLVFEAEASGPHAVAGLTQPAAARVWDVSDPAAPLAVLGEADLAGSVAFEATAGRRYAVADAPREAASVSFNEPSSWRSGGGADWLAIAPAELLPSLEPLRALRESQGLATALVDVEDVFDEASGGVFSPPALRDFVGDVLATWQPAPRFLLLVGDASYDYRDFLGRGVPLGVPTMLVDTSFVEAASDSFFAQPEGETAPRLAIGRLPVRSAAGLESLVAKLIAYESALPGDGPWSTRLLLVADDGAGAGNPVETEAFGAAVEGLAAHAPGDFERRRVRLGALPDAGVGAAARTAILGTLAEGAALAVYAGHGGARMWADEGIFGTSDVTGLVNARWPFFVVLGCLNGFFDAPSEESLAEVAVEAADRGAVAFLASTTVSAFPGQAALAGALGERLLRANVRRVGDAVAQSLQALSATPGAEDVVQSFVLVGDPATRLALPEVPVADAGPDVETSLGGWARLEGAISEGPASGPIAWSWRLAEVPAGSSPALMGADAAVARLLPDVPGVYVLELVAAVGGRESAPDAVRVTVGAAAPFACGGQPGAQQARFGPELLYLLLPALLARAATRGARRREPR
jgi:hypothetical protein